MMGAHAFATQHPRMQEVGLAINYEAMGSGGPSQLYMTSQQNGWLITEFLKAAPYPLGSSLMDNVTWVFSEQRLGSDLEEYMARGSAGLDFYYSADTSVYHTMQENVQLIDPRSIQHDGSYALSLVRHFDSMDLSQVLRAPDEVFFNVLPNVVVHYPSTWAFPLAALVALLFLAMLVLGFRRRRLTLVGFTVGVLVFLGGLIGALTLLILLWWALKAVNPNYQVFLIGPYGIDLAVLGLAALVIAMMSALYLWLRRRVRMENLAAGALVWWVILMMGSSLYFPGGSYLFTWPLLFGVLALGWLFFTTEQASHPWLRAAVLSVAALPRKPVLMRSSSIPRPTLRRRRGVSPVVPGHTSSTTHLARRPSRGAWTRCDHAAIWCSSDCPAVQSHRWTRKYSIARARST